MSAKKMTITQVRSAIGCPQDQKDTVRALGLKRVRDSVVQPDTPTVRGMVRKVRHLVEVADG